MTHNARSLSRSNGQRPLVRHFTPHLNGGLGRVLLSTLKHAETAGTRYAHEIVLLDDKHISAEAREIFAPYWRLLNIGYDDHGTSQLLAEADIAQIEWWNHPLIIRLLAGNPFPAARLVICCHVGGLNRPHIITENVVAFADTFLAASRAAHNHPIFTQHPELAKKLRFVTYPVDIERIGPVTPRVHDGFAVGYVGTLDYSKLHPDFLAMSAAVNVPDIRFISCGFDTDGRVEADAVALGEQRAKFEFLGFTNDVTRVLEGLDVFGYPLMRTHFGSGEQALIEAMYAGLPVVVFDNPPEREIVTHEETGLIVDSAQAYSQAIEALYRDPALRRRLGQAGRAAVLDRLGPKRCFEALDCVYDEVMATQKRTRVFQAITAPHPPDMLDLGARLFVEALGPASEEFRSSFEAGRAAVAPEILQVIASIEPAMKGRTKGSLFQYLYFFPDDPFLTFWAGLVRSHEGNSEEARRLLAIARKSDPENQQFRARVGLE